MTETMQQPPSLHDSQPARPHYRSQHPGRLLPTASTFGPMPNYGGEVISLPLVGVNKKGFASGKVAYDPVARKRLLGEIIRANTSGRKDQAQRDPAEIGAVLQSAGRSARRHGFCEGEQERF